LFFATNTVPPFVLRQLIYGSISKLLCEGLPMSSMPHGAPQASTQTGFRKHALPPIPKSIRVLTVLEQRDAEQTPERSTGSQPGTSSGSKYFKHSRKNSWQVAWAVVVGLFLAIAATWLYFWLRNQLGI
jgi:hypothetical protein